MSKIKGDPTVPDLDLREIVRMNINFANWLCCFIPDFEKISTREVLYLIYFVLFNVFLFILSFVSQLIDLVTSWGDIERMTQVSFLCFTNLVQCFKLYCFIGYGSKMWKLIHSMNREIFRPRTIAQYNILVQETKKSKLITTLFFSGCTLTCTMWTIAPLLDVGHTGSVQLPLSGWYPFPVDRSPNFEFAYIYQILTTWLCGIGDISMDTFMSGSLMFICAELAVLNNALENMNNNGSENLTEEERRNINEDLKRNAIHYENIIEFGNEAIGLFSAGITAQIVAGVIVLCMSMFRLSVTDFGTFQFYAMGIYQICMFIEIYLSCFFGNEVILKSKELTQSAYNSGWVDAPNDFKQSLIIFMTRTQFALQLDASGYFPLSIETFKSIAKSSWSYFAVLNQVNQS